MNATTPTTTTARPAWPATGPGAPRHDALAQPEPAWSGPVVHRTTGGRAQRKAQREHERARAKAAAREVTVRVRRTPEQRHARMLAALRKDVMAKGGRLPAPVQVPDAAQRAALLDTVADWMHWGIDQLDRAWKHLSLGMAAQAMAAPLDDTDLNEPVAPPAHPSLAAYRQKIGKHFLIEPLFNAKDDTPLDGCVVLIADTEHRVPKVQKQLTWLVRQSVQPGDRLLVEAEETDEDALGMERFCRGVVESNQGECQAIDMPDVLSYALGEDRMRQAWDHLRTAFRELAPLAGDLDLTVAPQGIQSVAKREQALTKLWALLMVAKEVWGTGTPTQRMRCQRALSAGEAFENALELGTRKVLMPENMNARDEHFSRRILDLAQSAPRTSFVILGVAHIEPIAQRLAHKLPLLLVYPRQVTSESDVAQALANRQIAEESKAGHLIDQLMQRIDRDGIPSGDEETGHDEL